MERLSVAFYLFSTADDQAGLKMAAILFDETFLLVPNLVSLRVMPSYEQKYLRPAWDRLVRFREQISPLVEDGAVHLLEPDLLASIPSVGDEDLWWLLLDELEGKLGDEDKRVHNWSMFLAGAAEKFGAVPLTASAEALAAFSRGVPNLQAASGPIDEEMRELDHLAAALTLEVVRAELPDWSQLPFEDVLQLRSELSDSLLGLRIQMGSLAASIKSRPWEADMPRELAQVVRRDVAPALLELRRASAAMPRRRMGIAVDAARSFKPLGLLATVFVGVPTEIAAAAAAGTVGLDTWLQTRALTDSIDKNGMSFFLRARSLTNRL